jgi:putative restriction endonuclease
VKAGATAGFIANFGFFVRYERVPSWLAWESFGDKNGTDTFAEMAARTRGDPPPHEERTPRETDYEVGCIIVDDQVIPQPEAA